MAAPDHIQSSSMSQNIYDDPDFLEGYSQLPRSVKGLAGAPEWPTLQAFLPLHPSPALTKLVASPHGLSTATSTKVSESLTGSLQGSSNSTGPSRPT